MKYEVIYHPEGIRGFDPLALPGQEDPTGYPPSIGLKLTDAERKAQYGAWDRLAFGHGETEVLFALARIAERLAADLDGHRLGANTVPRLGE